MTAERQPFDRKNTDIKARFEAKKPTPKQISSWIDMNGSDPIFNEGVIDIYSPTEADIEQKQEVVKRKKR